MRALKLLLAFLSLPRLLVTTQAHEGIETNGNRYGNVKSWVTTQAHEGIETDIFVKYCI